MSFIGSDATGFVRGAAEYAKAKTFDTTCRTADTKRALANTCSITQIVYIRASAIKSSRVISLCKSTNSIDISTKTASWNNTCIE